MEVADALAGSPALFAAVAALTGLVIGSFLNVVIHRLPIMMEREWKAQCAELLDQPAPQPGEPFDLLRPPSHCPRCRQRIPPLQNIPLLSYLLQRGRCAHCGAPISLRYPLVEALAGAMAAIVALRFGFGWDAAAAIALSWALIAASFIDLEHQLLPDAITLPFLWLGLGLALLDTFAPLADSVIGAMAGYLSLWAVYHLFRLVTGKEGMGRGDFKLLALFGAWLGWQSLVAIVLLSSLVGAACGIVLIVARGRDRGVPMPFGPFIASAGWLAMLWGQEINTWYLTCAGL